MSLLVFVIFLVEFMVVPQVGNTTFLILTVASLLDVVMGFTVTISTASRDFAFERQGGEPRQAEHLRAAIQIIRPASEVVAALAPRDSVLVCRNRW